MLFLQTQGKNGEFVHNFMIFAGNRPSESKTELFILLQNMKDGSSIRGEAQEEINELKAQLRLSEKERNKAKEKEPVKTESKKWWKLWK